MKVIRGKDRALKEHNNAIEAGMIGLFGGLIGGRLSILISNFINKSAASQGFMGGGEGMALSHNSRTNNRSPTSLLRYRSNHRLLSSNEKLQRCPALEAMRTEPSSFIAYVNPLKFWLWGFLTLICLCGLIDLVLWDFGLLKFH